MQVADNRREKKAYVNIKIDCFNSKWNVFTNTPNKYINNKQITEKSLLDVSSKEFKSSGLRKNIILSVMEK
jgi:hypothetical protein